MVGEKVEPLLSPGEVIKPPSKSKAKENLPPKVNLSQVG